MCLELQFQVKIRHNFGDLPSSLLWCRLSPVLKVCVLSSFLYAANSAQLMFSEKKWDAQRTEVAKALVHPMTATYTAVIIINK